MHLKKISVLFLVFTLLIFYQNCSDSFVLTTDPTAESSSIITDANEPPNTELPPIVEPPPIKHEPEIIKVDVKKDCVQRAQVVESDLVHPSNDNSDFFVTLDFENNEKSNLTGSFTEEFCYSGKRALDSKSKVGKNYSTGGGVKLPTRIGLGDEIWMRFRIYFPEGYIFSSCAVLGLGNCATGETNTSIKFVGIDFNDGYDNIGRHWFNLTHDNSKYDYRWVYEGHPGGFTTWSGNDIQRGQWETFEYYTKFGLTADTSETRIYKNAELIFQKKSKTISNSSMLMDSLWILQYWNGGAPASQSVYFDEIIMTTKTPKKLDENGKPYLGY